MVSLNPCRTGFFALLFMAGAAAQAQAPPNVSTLESPAPQERGAYGSAVAVVPDVDGDGADDLLVGAPVEYPDTIQAGNQTLDYQEGRAYLYSGVTGTLLYTLSNPVDEIPDHFGFAVSGVPDLDGDGRGDLVVGGQGDEIRYDVLLDLYYLYHIGHAYVFSGATGTLLYVLDTPEPTDLESYGAAVAGVPDLNGDGRGDLLIGAPFEDRSGGRRDAGRAYVVSGATGTLLSVLQSPSSVPPIIDGHFGLAVSGVPDTDGDGVDDLLVGAPYEDRAFDEAGRAYLFSGATRAVLATIGSVNQEEGGQFGYDVAGLEDVDGDGLGDLLIGAPFEDNPQFPFSGTDAGRTYVLSGATRAVLHTLLSPNHQQEGHFGSAVTGVGDWDGDGLGDLLVGARDEDCGLVDAGRAYLLSGATGVSLLTLDSPNPQVEGSYGLAVAGITDGDGPGRFVVGATYESGGALLAGRAYRYQVPRASLTLTLTPTNPPPPVVLRRGDRLRYRADFDTAPDGPSSVEYWAEATFPNGSVRALFGPSALALVPGSTVSRSFQQRVPSNAPFGDYTLTMYAGTYPSDVLASDSFPLTVTNAAPRRADDEADDTWAAYDEAGRLLDASAEAPAVAPVETVLLAPAPNPATGRSTLRYTLAEAGTVRLAVYDALGREVAVLVDGARESGPHEVVFDASVLAPGVYLVRLQAGASPQTRRFVVAR